MRKSSISHAIAAQFSVTGRDLIDLFVDFCSVKKLAWSPDVKVAMAKMPASNIGEAVWSVFNDLPVKTTQGLLADLLKPIKQHQLFDLADWLRDLNSGQIPDYLQTYWSNNRIPKQLDELVKKALGAEAIDISEVAAGTGDEDEETRMPKKAGKPRKAAKPKKTYKVGVKENGERVALNGFDIPLVEAAKDALTAPHMTDKGRWLRVHKAVGSLLAEHGLSVTTTRPQREVTDDDHQSLVRYYLTSAGNKKVAPDYKAFQDHMDKVFGKALGGIEPSNDEEIPGHVRVWFNHA